MKIYMNAGQKNPANRKARVAVITCYSQPDYVRAESLRQAFGQVEDLDIDVIKNRNKGVLRYLEVCVRLLVFRFRKKANLYVLTFRGYEMLLPVRLLTMGRPLWYDEFINPIEWAVHEHKILPDVRLWRCIYRGALQMVQLVLTDTNSHADLSARITGMSREKLAALPVGSVSMMRPDPYRVSKMIPLRVLFYGTMLPLHGVDIICRAAEMLKDESVEFEIIGADGRTKQLIEHSISRGANIAYEGWVEYPELMKKISRADLFLGGPFGDTLQADHVVTGKTYQALEIGRPVIIGQTKAMDGFIDKENCLVAKKGDAGSLAEKIQWACTHRSRLTEIARSGHELYLEKFSARVIAKQLDCLLKKEKIL